MVPRAGRRCFCPGARASAREAAPKSAGCRAVPAPLEGICHQLLFAVPGASEHPYFYFAQGNSLFHAGLKIHLPKNRCHNVPHLNCEVVPQAEVSSGGLQGTGFSIGVYAIFCPAPW